MSRPPTLKDYINCFAGLAWLESPPFDQPKTGKMKTQRSKRPTVKDSAKELFQLVFHFTNRLENHFARSEKFEDEINTIIDSADTLI